MIPIWTPGKTASSGSIVGRERAGVSGRPASIPDMASWDNVRRLALALPETDEHGSYGDTLAWRVKQKAFVWERPLRPADREALGDSAPDGPVLGAWVADLGVKEELLVDSPDVYFTSPHFDGYRAVLVRLDQISVDELEELVLEAWLARAPKRIAKSYLDGLARGERPARESRAAVARSRRSRP